MADPFAGLARARMQPRDAEIDVYGATHQGKVRPDNQDHFLICSLHKTMRVVGTSLPDPRSLQGLSERLAFFGMVADGVGGGFGGEEASRAALHGIATYATHTLNCYYTFNPDDHEGFSAALETAAKTSHESVLARGREKPEIAGLATTLTTMISVWPWVYVLHVGDSRAYRLREGRLDRLTRDQTLAQELIESGTLSEANAERSPLSHVLLSAIGGTARPEVGRFESELGDVVLLCTDGLTKHVSDERIRDRLMAMASAAEVCRALIDDALAEGGTDNITLIVGRARPA